ncbi:MAG: sigma-70 family RNA polymerase sigma factor [Blastocatellales bacterium]
MKSESDITRLLHNWQNGDQDALNELMPLVYDELRRLARAYLRKQPHHETLQPTVLVHEMYLRMINQQEVSWESRAQFYGMAATLMRRILVDHTREKMAHKRGGGEVRLSLSKADRFTPRADIDLIALDDALKELENLNSQHARIVELRFFGGLTIEETAAVLGVSHATIERGWSLARAWLRREVRNDHD